MWVFAEHVMVYHTHGFAMQIIMEYELSQLSKFLQDLDQNLITCFDGSNIFSLKLGKCATFHIGVAYIVEQLRSVQSNGS